MKRFYFIRLVALIVVPILILSMAMCCHGTGTPKETIGDTINVSSAKMNTNLAEMEYQKNMQQLTMGVKQMTHKYDSLKEKKDAEREKVEQARIAANDAEIERQIADLRSQQLRWLRIADKNYDAYKMMCLSGRITDYRMQGYWPDSDCRDALKKTLTIQQKIIQLASRHSDRDHLVKMYSIAYEAMKTSTKEACDNLDSNFGLNPYGY